MEVGVAHLIPASTDKTDFANVDCEITYLDPSEILRKEGRLNGICKDCNHLLMWNDILEKNSYYGRIRRALVIVNFYMEGPSLNFVGKIYWVLLADQTAVSAPPISSFRV